MPGLLSDLFYNTPKRYWGDKLSGLLDAASLGAETYAGATKPYTKEQAQTIGGLLADFTPVVGDVKSGYEGVQAAKQGDWLGAGLGALGALPFVPNMAGIVAPSMAKTLNIGKKLPEDELFRAAVANTPNASVTDDGLRMMVQRNQQAAQSGAESVRGGVFYLPEGAAQGKHYSTGKNGYGGTEKVTGETLVMNPLFAKGGTGGKAPESAYDSLIGKGAYQSMRTDALKAYGPYGAPPSAKISAARDFLSKYAPEMADSAEHIVQNSKQGNQLAYALQEAAVASAARKAGHDAVLGYSKGKNGPFLSELFDVRESHYPDKFGGSTVWDSLLGP